jgi:Raf kinase inhibitor-like YbhB/YbcL family protein
MRLTSPAFEHGAPIPVDYVFGVHDPETHVSFGPNRNPPLEWDGVPDGTRSFALTMIDRNVPSRPDDVNQEGREVPADLPRVDFTHWVLVDLPPDRRRIEAGEFARDVVPRGRTVSEATPREGVNDYTGWFEGDADMEGTYRGYDGPCPPWNDSIVHHYDVTLYALDVAELDVPADFTAGDVIAAAEGHTLGSATLTGTYTINPKAR